MTDQDRLLGQLEANQTILVEAISELKQQIRDMGASTTQARKVSMSEQDKLLLGQLQANQQNMMKAISELKQQIRDMDASTTKAYSELNARVSRLERAWGDIRIGTRIVLWVAAAIGSAIGAIGTWIINIMKA